jgi:hypothetical protein
MNEWMNECPHLKTPLMNEWMRGTRWKNLPDDVGEGSLSNTLKVHQKNIFLKTKRQI